MAVNKKNAFSETEVSQADFAKALSHPARIAILKTLAEKKSCICGEIVEVLPLAQATVSQHLKELKTAGLISGEISGVKSCYCINWDQFGLLADQFIQYLQELKAMNGSGCSSC